MNENPSNTDSVKDTNSARPIQETWDKVEDKAEELWKQFQAKTGFSDDKIADLKTKASHKIDELKAEMETWDDTAKVKWEELKGKSGDWWAKIKDKFEGGEDTEKTEDLWKQLQSRTGFTDEKIADLKLKASHKIDELKAEVETWDDTTKAKWEELKGKSGNWWTKIKDQFEGEEDKEKTV